MLFLPLTVWLLGKNYGQVTNHKFYLKLTFRNMSNPVWKPEIKKKICFPGLATRGQALPLFNSLHGNSNHSQRQKTKDQRRDKSMAAVIVSPQFHSKFQMFFSSGEPHSDCNPTCHFLPQHSF